MRKIIFLIALSAFFILPGEVFARRTDVSNWYIDVLKVEIVVNKDSSLTITEDISADCGNVPDKHGIFRILPTAVNTTKGAIDTPVKLISIADASGRAYKYAENYNTVDKVVVWKIGDAGITVTGENFYRIKYTVENAVRTENSKKFDEFYWNLNGAFWDLEIDDFTAYVVFPPEISKNNASISYYSGTTGDKGLSLVNYQWVGDNTLEFKSTRPMKAREGIIASITFPKNIITPHKAGILDSINRQFFWLLLPLAVFSAYFKVWRKFGGWKATESEKVDDYK